MHFVIIESFLCRMSTILRLLYDMPRNHMGYSHGTPRSWVDRELIPTARASVYWSSGGVRPVVMESSLEY